MPFLGSNSGGNWTVKKMHDSDHPDHGEQRTPPSWQWSSIHPQRLLSVMAIRKEKHGHMGRTRVAHNTQIRITKYTQMLTARLTNTKYRSRGRAALPSPISELAGADSCNLTNCFIFNSTIHASPYLVEHNAKQAHVPNIAHINTNVNQ